MPILASLGLANKKAFGFANGDQIGFDLPSSITDNALMILDASNPLSYAGERDIIDIDALTFSTFNSFSFLPMPPNSPIFIGDTVTTAGGTGTVTNVIRNVWIYIPFASTSYLGDKVYVDNSAVINYGYSTQITVNPTNGYIWYDISGNNNNASWSYAPILSGSGGNKSIQIQDSNPLTVGTGVASNTFTYIIVGTVAKDKVVNPYWRSRTFLQDSNLIYEPYFGSGSTTRHNESDIWHNTNALHYVQVSGTSTNSNITSRQGGTTKYYTASRDSYGTGTALTTALDIWDANIKFIAIYTTPPSLTDAYNALKTRFQL